MCHRQVLLLLIGAGFLSAPSAQAQYYPYPGYYAPGYYPPAYYRPPPQYYYTQPPAYAVPPNYSPANCGTPDHFKPCTR